VSEKYPLLIINTNKCRYMKSKPECLVAIMFGLETVLVAILSTVKVLYFNAAMKYS